MKINVVDVVVFVVKWGYLHVMKSRIHLEIHGCMSVG